MPELPEVETVKEGLKKFIKPNTKLSKIELRRENLRFPFPENLSDCHGKKIIGLSRRAKYLLIELDKDLILVSHLGMTGTWRKKEKDETYGKHDHVILHLNDKTELIYNDIRRFGFLDLVKKDSMESNKHFNALGPEPLSEEFNFDHLYKITRKKESSIKSLIMNQKFVVGVGNIYAVESLFKAKIKPQRKAKTTTKKEIELLVESIKETIALAIKAGGSSISDYKNADGKLGYFQHSFQVYGREKQECYTCETPLKNITLSGRASCYCPQCQK